MFPHTCQNQNLTMWSKDRKGSTSLCVSSPLIPLYLPHLLYAPFCLCPPLFPSLSTPSALPFSLVSPLPTHTFSSTRLCFITRAPVISLDIKKYTSTEQLWAIKKNRFSPGPCECGTVDAWR